MSETIYNCPRCFCDDPITEVIDYSPGAPGVLVECPACHFTLRVKTADVGAAIEKWSNAPVLSNRLLRA